MAISIEELKRLIQKEKSQLSRMETKEAFEVNSLSEGKYFRYENSSNYDPWFTFSKVLSVKKQTATSALVISFEKNIFGQCVYWNNYRRKVNLLGEEISKEEFESEFEKFSVTIKHFQISVRI